MDCILCMSYCIGMFQC
uniref:Uncharacterized protein n=1 Tax=Arundo donax TaxID=35708 RepID=A0A0A8XXH6_ARUDO